MRDIWRYSQDNSQVMSDEEWKPHGSRKGSNNSLEEASLDLTPEQCASARPEQGRIDSGPIMPESPSSLPVFRFHNKFADLAPEWRQEPPACSYCAIQRKLSSRPSGVPERSAASDGRT